MRKLIYIGLFILISAFSSDREKVFSDIRYDSFARGERLEYKVSFGIFTVGKGTITIDEKFYKINNRLCYKIDTYGKTSGMVDWIARVDDHWGAYVDSAALVPHISYRNIKEGKYRKNEIVYFDHVKDSIEAKTINKKTGEWKTPVPYKAPNNVREFLSGMLYMRTIDFSKMKPRDTFRLSGFFEDTFYELDVMFLGREKVKTKAGKFRALKLVPVMPDNELFDGEDSVVAWVSDDKNKIPLKVEAKMFIGHAGVELDEYYNLQHPPSKL